MFVVFGVEGNIMYFVVVWEMDCNVVCGVKVIKFLNINSRVYKIIFIYLFSDMRKDFNYSVCMKVGVVLECLLIKEGFLIGIMFVKFEDEEMCVKLSNKEFLKTFFDEYFSMFVFWIKDEDIESMVNSKFFGLLLFGYVDKFFNMGG